MASYDQNLRNIRGAAVDGPTMRESIAEGIEQAQGLIEIQRFDARLEEAKRKIIQEAVTLDIEKITNTDDDYLLIML